MMFKEAVDILKHADTDSEIDTDDYLKAFDMAVSALETFSLLDHIKGLGYTTEEAAKMMRKKNMGLDQALKIIL